MSFGKRTLPRLLFALVLFSLLGALHAQSSSDRLHIALNPYVDFANESLHMLWAIHLRLEAYNIQSNQFVSGERTEAIEFKINDIIRNYSYFGSLQGVCLRAYGVTDPSVNLERLLEETKVREMSLSSSTRRQVNIHRDRMWELMRELLDLCLALSDYAANEVFLEDVGLLESYRMLERCEEIFEEFELERKQLAAAIQAASSSRPAALEDLELILDRSQNLLASVRKIDYDQLQGNISELEEAIASAQIHKQDRLQALSKLGLYYDRGTTVYKHVINYASQMVRWSRTYMNGGPVSPVYRDYGREYYYYNERLLALYNHHKYGLVAYYNQFLGFANTILVKQVEETPRFIVIPPIVLIPEDEIVEVNAEIQEEIPVVISSKLEDEIATNHLIFLLDVSASMKKPEKLPLLKESLRHTLASMRPEDRISIITYSGTARVVLSAATATDEATIMDAVNHLGSGGETHFQKGLKTAYELAEEEFIIHGNNRIILATDGDFIFKSSAMRLAEKYREKPVYLSVLLFSKFETLLVREQFTRLALAGNGNYVHVREDNAMNILLEEAAAIKRR